MRFNKESKISNIKRSRKFGFRAKSAVVIRNKRRKGRVQLGSRFNRNHS